MLSFEEAGNVLDELVDELPDGIFDKLNGGVSLLEDPVIAEDGRYTLGMYIRSEMGRYIELYYGSFVELYGEMDDEKFRERLKKTLHHELTHHIESMAGDRSLERWDERQSELLGFNGIDVESILFVCDDDSALAPAAAKMFENLRTGRSAGVICSSAGIAPAEGIAPKAAKACVGLGFDISAHRPTAVSGELIEAHSITLCMTLAQSDELARRYQQLDERIMCLCEDDITPPMLSLGWKKLMQRVRDEVLAVIDEINQEDEL